MTKKLLIASGLALSLALSSGAAFAKGHAQGDDSRQTAPGTDVGSETVGSAQGLGNERSNNNPGADRGRGNSANAGKPSGGSGGSGDSGHSGR